MLGLHGATRRRVCRTLFVVLCLAPTVGVSAWSAVRQSSWYYERQAAERMRDLSTALGLDAKLHRQSWTGAGHEVLEGVAVRDPETDRLIAETRRLEMVDSGADVTITLSQPEFDLDALARVADLLHETLRRRRGPAPRILIVAQELTCRTPPHAQTLFDFTAAIESLPEGPRLTLEFRYGQADQPLTRLQVERRRRRDAPYTAVELVTRGTPLPCQLLRPLLPALAVLGADCHFQGRLAIEFRPEGTQGELQGRLAPLDLDRLVTQHFPHKLSGQGILDLRECRIAAGKIVAAMGQLESTGGVVSESLLAAAAAQFGWERPAVVPGVIPPQLRAYARLAGDFTLEGHQLAITAAADAPPIGVLLRDNDGPLLRHAANSATSTSTLSLVRTLVPQSDHLVPATAATENLWRALPTPPILRTEVDTAPPYVPLRLRGNQGS